MPLHQGFRLGKYDVSPARCTLRGPDGEVSIHPHAMEVLLLLAQNTGKLVTRRRIMQEVWGSHPVTQDTLTHNIAELRRALGDDPHTPIYIQTIPRRGYRLIPVPQLLTQMEPPRSMPPDSDPDSPKWRTLWRSLLQLIADLTRRKVFRAIATYGLIAWGIVQTADVFLPIIFDNPTPVLTVLMVLAAMGFPVVAVLAWALEVTERGIELDLGVSKWRKRSARKAYIVAGLVVALAVGAVTYFMVRPPYREGRVRIAVLPLDSLDGEDTGAFCAGMTEELTHMLAQIPEIKVAARKSSEVLAAAGLAVPDIASRLNVSHVLEGSCRSEDNALRITAQLIEAREGFHEWSKAYSVMPTTLFDIQQDIARQVARSLRLVLSSSVKEKLESEPTVSGEAYTLYVQARGYLRKARESQNLQKAEQLFRRAAQLDTDYAEPMAGLCETYLAWYELERAAERYEQARTACHGALEKSRDSIEVMMALAELSRYSGQYEDALERFTQVIGMDPTMADGYVGQGRAFAAMQRDAEAEAAFKSAIAADQVYWVSINAYGAFLFERGRYAEASEQFAKVTLLDPLNSAAFNNLGVTYYITADFKAAAQAFEQSIKITPKAAATANTGTMYFYAGDFGKAETYYRKAIEFTPEDYRLWGSLGDALAARSDPEAEGAYRRAAHLARTRLDINKEDHKARASLGHYLSRLGDAAQAEVLVRQAAKDAPGDMDVRYNEALVLAAIGRPDAALAAIRAALEAGYQPEMLRADPGLAALRSDPRFMETIERP